MRLTVQTDYAIRILLYAASFPDRLVTTKEVSDAYGISLNHLVRIVNILGHGGFLDMHRGRTGGVQLSRPAGAIRLGDVVRALEGDFNLVECFDLENNRCVVTPACKVKGALFRARKAFFDVLDSMTVGDCVADGGLVRFFPPPPIRGTKASKELRKLSEEELQGE